MRIAQAIQRGHAICGKLAGLIENCFRNAVAQFGIIAMLETILQAPGMAHRKEDILDRRGIAHRSGSRTGIAQSFRPRGRGLMCS